MRDKWMAEDWECRIAANWLHLNLTDALRAVMEQHEEYTDIIK